MSRCRCDPNSVAGCQCSFQDGDCIGFTGSGTSANPLTPYPILDSDSDNIASCGPSGLLVQVPELIKNPPRVRVRRTITQSIPGGNTPQFIEFNYTDYDVGGWFDPSADDFRVTVPNDGLYDISFFGAIAAPGGTFPVDKEIRIEIRKNATDIIMLDVTNEPNPLTGARLHSQDYLELRAGDYLGMVYWNGGTPDLNTGDSALGPRLTVVYRAPLAA